MLWVHCGGRCALPAPPPALFNFSGHVYPDASFVEISTSSKTMKDMSIVMPPLSKSLLLMT